MSLKKFGSLISGKILAPLLLFWLRYRFCGQAGLGHLAMLLPCALQFVGYQKVLGAAEPAALVEGLEASQWGWFLFALALPGEGPMLGAAGFWVSRMLLLLPLEALFIRRRYAAKWLSIFGFFGLVGCLPFASFAAYFQTFIPLMVEHQLQTMKESFDSAFSLWASVVMLSVVYQTCALGYFYWDKIARDELESPSLWGAPEALLCLGLLGSIALGLGHSAYGQALGAAFHVLGLQFS